MKVRDNKSFAENDLLTREKDIGESAKMGKKTPRPYNIK